ncbi:winged helix-turn-helix domain-containing protein [Entomohabitans teleogrylli]|uniref:winged helix-turn-helix domain-containing protein n=1 Tax=Entomohabitans teleogrylli TaxID=1384589 RepID=UPI00073D3E5F|nr:helix-turn-helix domain-containing protein [Entomohabitans teleogrylli]
MIYILNETLYYRTTDGLVRHVSEDDNHGMLLTPIVNRIFRVLIEQQGEIITKEGFIALVWEANGMEGSTNTLVQYMSHLRKILNHYLPDMMIITTVPRTGYTLSSDVTVSSIDQEDTIKTFTQKKRRPSTTMHYKKSIIILTFAITVLITLFIVADRLNDESIITPQHITPLFTYNSCPVYYLSSSEDQKDIANNTQIAKKIINNENISCTKDVSIYIAFNYSKTGNTPINAMLSRCIENGQYQNNCKSYQFNQW